MGFLTVKNFFCAFSKIPTKRTLVRLLFLKLNQSRNTKKHFFGGFFFKIQKHTFSGVQNGIFYKLNFKLVFLCLFFNVKRSFMPIFTKKYYYLGPLEFVQNENFDARAPKFWIWTSKIIPDLWLLDLFSLIKTNFHTPPYSPTLLSGNK